MRGSEHEASATLRYYLFDYIFDNYFIMCTFNGEYTLTISSQVTRICISIQHSGEYTSAINAVIKVTVCYKFAII